MRYIAITVIAFLVLLGVSMLAGRISTATSALDVEIELNRTVQKIAEKKLELASSKMPVDAEVYKFLSETNLHPWIQNWDSIRAALNTEQALDNHLLAKPRDTPWLDRYLILLTTQQSQLIEVAEHLQNKARNVLVFSAFSALILVATALSLVFWFIWITQRSHLAASNKLNQKLETQRETLVASQRAMISINDDEQHAQMRAEQLAGLVEQSSEAFIRLSANGLVEHSNHAATLLFPDLGDLPANAPFTQIFDEAQRSELDEVMQQALQDHKAITITPSQANLSESIEFTIAPVVDSDSQGAICISILARDVSIRIQEQEQLKQVIENAPNALFVCDQNAVIVMANNHTEELFGYDDGELNGVLIDELVSEDLRTSYAEARRRYMMKPRKAQVGHARDLFACRKDGSEFPVEVGLNPITVGEQSLVTVSIFDLTQQRIEQAKLADAIAELELRNKEMEQFIYTVSHDLKSPLFTISGFTHGLKESIQNITPDQEHQAERIQANVNHMGGLLEDLLQLSRVIRVELELDTIDTNAIVQQVETALEGAINETGTRIEITTPLAQIYANEAMLFQCIQNLMNNAIKYVADGVVPHLQIYTSETENRVTLHVKDNGIGIDPKYHDKIFEIFHRIASREGTGVGLSIVKTIMERHHGQIDLTSELGQGSTFSLSFSRPENGLTPH